MRDVCHVYLVRISRPFLAHALSRRDFPAAISHANPSKLSFIARTLYTCRVWERIGVASVRDRRFNTVRRLSSRSLFSRISRNENINKTLRRRAIADVECSIVRIAKILEAERVACSKIAYSVDNVSGSRVELFAEMFAVRANK